MSLLAPQGGKTPGRPPGYEAARGRRATDRSEAVLMVERGTDAVWREARSRHGAGCLEPELGILLWVGGLGVRVAESGADSTPSHPEPGRARRQRRKVLRGQPRGRRGRRAHAQAPNPGLRGPARGGAAAARWAHNPKV